MNILSRRRRFGVFTGVVLALVGLLLLLAFVGSESPSRDIVQNHLQQIAPPVPPPVRPCWYGQMCARVVTGTYDATWIITGTNDSLRNIGEYQTATFEQRILSRSNNSVEVSITGKAVVDTKAGFPLDTAQLPGSVQPYLQPTSSQQSDDPAIVEQAQALVKEAQGEAQAVVAILDWVRANIAYDYTFSLPTDAVSVYHNRSGVCTGFSNLAIALLRAVGIPARRRDGCAFWSLPHGGGHAWMEIYYPDVGWVPSEPQSEENFVSADHLVSSRWWDWCGKSGTTITVTEQVEGDELYLLRTSYSDDIWPMVYSAAVPDWDRHPARTSTSRLSFMLGISETGTTASVEVESTHCYSTTWQIESSAPWLSISPQEGNKKSKVLVTVNAVSLTLGLNSASFTVTTPKWYYYPTSRVIPVDVWIVENVHRTYLPLISRGYSP